MPLTQREIACFENNRQFQNEMAAALLYIASQMAKDALVVLANPASSEVQQTFAAIRRQIAGQILKEQGINVESLGLSSSSGQAVGGSTAMKYLMQQMLMSPEWTMTPDEWAANEATARVTIQTFLAGLLTTLTAAPGEEPEAPQGQTQGQAGKTSKRGARK
jgi:hypothetical protein